MKPEIEKHCYNCVHLNSPAIKCVRCFSYSNWVFNKTYKDGKWENGKWVKNKVGGQK